MYNVGIYIFIHTEEKILLQSRCTLFDKQTSSSVLGSVQISVWCFNLMIKCEDSHK